MKSVYLRGPPLGITRVNNIYIALCSVFTLELKSIMDSMEKVYF
jgi:hypothetical protein